MLPEDTPRVNPTLTHCSLLLSYAVDWVADLIDSEKYRQDHKEDFEAKWMEKNRDAMLHQLNKDAPAIVMDDEKLNFRELMRDKRLASKSPQMYCADRCIATGNCEVYEDIFQFSPEEVIEFCNDCVLVDEMDPDHEECDIPDTFYDLDMLKP